VAAGVGDVADLGEGVEVEDADVACGARARDVEIAAVRVGCDIVESAVAADFDGLKDLVGAGLRVGDSGEWKQNGEGGEYEQIA
jgi:hypothetical protein